MFLELLSLSLDCLHSSRLKDKKMTSACTRFELSGLIRPRHRLSAEGLVKILDNSDTDGTRYR